MKSLSSRLAAVVVGLLLSIPVSFGRTQWYNPMDGDVPLINGRAWNAEIGKSFARMPDRMQADMPKDVWTLSRNSAGLSVRFLSNSDTIQIKYTLDGQGFFLNMAWLDHSGVDLYGRDAEGSQHWIGSHMKWNYGDTLIYSYNNVKPRSFQHRGLEYEVFLPPYATVTSMQIGVDEGSTFEFIGESLERPIVIYGSSIVQGASPSRPGLMWANQVKRDLDYPVINLGFSGSAFMEPPLFEAMGEIDARLYVLDPIPNSYTLGEEIVKRMVSGVEYLRSKNDAPILLVECAGAVDSVLRADENAPYEEGNRWLRKAYDKLVAQGVKDLYYLTKKEIGMDEDSYIEGMHPNDIGNRYQAIAVEKKLREMLADDVANDRYPPVRQHRDGGYNWYNRHNDVVKLNKTTDPEVLFIGNSITHFWGGEPVSHNLGGDTWGKLWGKRRAVNMGFGWDRIENVFWRIYHGELDGCAPGDIFLLIGINNLNAGDKEDDVARGIVDLAKEIGRRQPQATVHVVEVYPCNGKEEIVARTNKMVRELLPTGEKMKLYDFSKCLLLKDGSGKIDPKLFVDGLHPNEKGYAALAKELKKQVGIK